jgi:DNA polymerase delta subunit 1
MVQFQAVAWHGEDTDTEYVIHIFGRTEDGKSVHVETPFEPYFFVRVGGDRTPQLIVQEYQPYSTATVRRKDLWGFRNQELSTFVKLGFKTLGELRECRPRGLKVYEKNLDPVLRFMHRTEIKSTGWLEVPESASPGYDSTCDIDLCVADWRTLKPVDRDDIAPLRIASLDIEACSESGAFPDAFRPNDVCFQVAVTTRAFGSDAWLDRKCFCVKRTEGQDMEWFETEREMLERLGEYLVKLDPDILTGWNIFGFDLEYLYNRSVVIAAGSKAHHWGRLRGRSNELVMKRLASNALGDNTLKMVPMLGRYVFDMFQDVKREHKLESYSLNNVSKVFLNDEKIDMPVKEMFRRFRSGEGLDEVAEYCIKDTELPHRIATKLCLIQNLIEMAKATWVPLSYLSERGQQIKVFSQVCRKARELGFMVPTLYSKTTGDEEKYQGATVLDAQTGAYYGPVTALDFASLYPSIMRAHNLCYSTLVIDPKFGNIPGIVYEQYGPYKFAQGVSSLLPAILNELAAFRKKAKKLMAAAEGTPMEAVYNGQQLAYKISMNSIYGFTGATKGMLPCVAIASTVTMRGRQMIEETKNYVEEHFPGAKVRYGDSVMPGTPVLVRRNRTVSVENIESLGQDWNAYPGFLKDGTDKEQCDTSSIESWTHEGWKPIKRVIRHKCTKKIYRVLTHTGLVDVTEDHSLLSPTLELLKPMDIEVGQKLYHAFPEKLKFNEICSVEEAFILGMFVGDGSCGIYDCPSGRKASWAINNKDLLLLEKCKQYCELIHTDYEFVIMDTLKSSGVYKLSPRGGSVTKLCETYRSMCYDGQAKRVPVKAFGNPHSFLDGLWASDGCRRDNEIGGCHRIDTKNHVTAQWYYIFLRYMDFNVSLNTRSDKTDVFRLTWSMSQYRKDPYTIKKIDLLYESYDGYVYDLETEAGTFQAGIGQMIVKNTDSVMVEFDVQGRKGQEAIDYSWEQGEQAAEQCTKLFKAPNDLELEKVYCPYFLYSKKRYAAKMYEKKGESVVFKKIDIKGLQVVRRDTCPFVRGVLKELLNLVLNSEDPRPAIEYARESARKLLKGKVEFKDLTMSKQLSAEYKTRVPHVEVRNKIRARAPGSEPQNGDRVAFLVTKGPGLLCDKAEDPSWVAEHKVPIDYVYYFDHQMAKPVCDLLEPLVGANPFQTIFKSVDYLTTPSIMSFYQRKGNTS